MLTELQLSPMEPLIRPLVPESCRAVVELLWRLDSRLAELALSGREPVLRQIRLTWWRDALAALGDANARVPDEPLLQEVAATLVPALSADAPAALADKWLTALSAEWRDADVMAAGEELFALTARLLGNRRHLGGGPHALVRLALHMDDGLLREKLMAAAARQQIAPGQARVLAVLDRLARAIAQRRGARHRLAEQGLVLRVGLFGR